MARVKPRKLPIVYNRASILDVSEMCGLAPALSEDHGAGRAAAMGTAFHAVCGEQPDRGQALRRLTAEEVDEIMSWQMPADVDVNGVTLSYPETTEREITVAMDEDGAWCEPDHPRTLTVGHPDMYWHVGDVVYVGDIKKSKWTVDSPDTLQLHAYAQALAAKLGASAYMCGIWAATEGEWAWGELVDVLDSDPIFERIKHAARHRSDTGSTGPHCRGCYGRLHCPEHLLPAALGDTPLKAVVDGGELNPETALDALLAVKAHEDLAKAAKATLQEYARRAGGIPDGNGKVYRACPSKGRATLDKAALKAAGVDLDEYTSRGEPGERFQWTKEKVTK